MGFLGAFFNISVCVPLRYYGLNWSTWLNKMYKYIIVILFSHVVGMFSKSQ